MKKYAFIANAPGLSSLDYVTNFNDGEYENIIAAFDGVEAGMEYAQLMIMLGTELIDLCGDFTDENVAALKAIAPGVEVHHAGYFPEELAKLEALEQYVEYVMIIMANVEEPIGLELKAPEMNTYPVFVKDIDMAIAAAEEYARKGVDGIELCSAFNAEDTKRIIAAVEAIDPKVPVGSNGLA